MNKQQVAKSLTDEAARLRKNALSPRSLMVKKLTVLELADILESWAIAVMHIRPEEEEE